MCFGWVFSRMSPLKPVPSAEIRTVGAVWSMALLKITRRTLAWEILFTWTLSATPSIQQWGTGRGRKKRKSTVTAAINADTKKRIEARQGLCCWRGTSGSKKSLINQRLSKGWFDEDHPFLFLGFRPFFWQSRLFAFPWKGFGQYFVRNYYKRNVISCQLPFGYKRDYSICYCRFFHFYRLLDLPNIVSFWNKICHSSCFCSFGFCSSLAEVEFSFL